MVTVINASFYGGDKNIAKVVNQPQYEGVEYILYTNKPEEAEGTSWRVEEMQTSTPRLTARDIKVNIHKYAPNSEYWLWIDSNMEVKVDPNELVKTYLHNHDICLMPHPERNNWYEEANFLVQRDETFLDPVQSLFNVIGAEGHLPISLYETGVLLRRNTQQIQTFSSYWWEMVSTKCIRDQLSFPYAAWKAGLAVIRCRLQ
mgnify:CR=1 FL=1